MTRHELKCHPDYFAALLSGAKVHETRFNDRGFEVGDELLLKEFSPDSGYTGRELVREVTYIAYASAMTPVAEGYVVMSLADGCPHGIPWSRDCPSCNEEMEELATFLRPALLTELVRKLDLTTVVDDLVHADRDDILVSLRPLLALVDRAKELEALINTPEIEHFDKALPREAAHQVLRWGTKHDEGKTPEDWYWLIGHLAGRALFHWKESQRIQVCSVETSEQVGHHLTKARHHCITTAAALRNMHAHLRSGTSVMRPGTEAPGEVAA